MLFTFRSPSPCAAFQALGRFVSARGRLHLRYILCFSYACRVPMRARRTGPSFVIVRASTYPAHFLYYTNFSSLSQSNFVIFILNYSLRFNDVFTFYTKFKQKYMNGFQFLRSARRVVQRVRGFLGCAACGRGDRCGGVPSASLRGCPPQERRATSAATGGRARAPLGQRVQGRGFDSPPLEPSGLPYLTHKRPEGCGPLDSGVV